MIPMDGIEDLPPAHKEKLLETIERMQARDSLTLYNNVVARCFEDCVSEFRRRELDLGEEKCISKCAEKFMKHSQRVGVRFGELSSELEQKVQDQMQQMKQ
eukprot:jgi/Ulvmu1/5905/UM026_0027.1